MNEIQQVYLTNFERIAKGKLSECGFIYEMLPESRFESFYMLLKKGSIEHVLCFSTHHLDWEDGVKVCSSSDRKFHWESVVLPAKIDADLNNTYGFTGTAMLADIERLIKDICLL
jgi:hypothetical protein